MEEKTNDKTEVKADNPSTPKGALAGALMRTFKGDITKELGSEAPKVVEQLVPAFKSDKKEEVKPEGKKQDTPKVEHKAVPKSVLHTYEGDVQDMVKRRKFSLVRMAAAEADQKDGQKYELEQPKAPKRPIGIYLVIASLVVLGVVSLLGVLYTYSLREGVGTYVPSHKSIIFTDRVETIDITGKISHSLKQELTRLRKGAYFSPGSIVELLLVEQRILTDADRLATVPLNAKELLDALGVPLSSSFSEVFEDAVMLGIYASEDNEPFLILQTNLYDYAFEKVFSWENNMERDLAPLFSPGANFAELDTFDADTLFTDTVVNNLDVRVLRDKNKRTRIIYSFTNKNTLLITTSIPAFIELAGRLRVAQ